MSSVARSENEDPSNDCPCDSGRAVVSVHDSDHKEGSEDEAREVMVLALRSQIREALRDEHLAELGKVKETYEAEVQELRADVAAMQQAEAKQLEREQRLKGQLWLECTDTPGHPDQCATLKARVIRLQDVIADMREEHAKEIDSVKGEVEKERAKVRDHWQEQVASVRAWHTEAVATLQASHIEEVARLRDEHLATLHSTRAAGEAALEQAHLRHKQEVAKLKADAAAAAAKSAERCDCLEQQHVADMAVARRRATAAVRDGCAAAAAEARSAMQQRTVAAEQAGAAAAAEAQQAQQSLERERKDNREHQGLLWERLEAAQGKLEVERRLHEQRMRELSEEAGQLRAGAAVVAGDCRTVHTALARVLRENSELRSQLDAERLISSSLSRAGQRGVGVQAFRPVSAAKHGNATQHKRSHHTRWQRDANERGGGQGH